MYFNFYKSTNTYRNKQKNDFQNSFQQTLEKEAPFDSFDDVQIHIATLPQPEAEKEHCGENADSIGVHKDDAICYSCRDTLFYTDVDDTVDIEIQNGLKDERKQKQSQQNYERVSL